MYLDTEISNDSDLIMCSDLCFLRSLRQACMIVLISAGSSSSSGQNSSHAASMACASNGSEGCSESLVISGVDLSVFSEIVEMI